MVEVISVRLRDGRRNHDFDPQGVQIEPGQQVIVETPQGPDLAVCTIGNHSIDDSDLTKTISPIIRVATEDDCRIAESSRAREQEAFEVCEQKIAKHGLDMKLVKVSSSFDGNKITFYFTSDGRVDFRGLVRDLASVFRARIELRQIGVRDEAKLIGGLGICGRPFCCSQFLDSFLPVSIKMAKTQNLSLNPTKISGTCGRLMCCLKYEQDAYEDAVKRMPKLESFVQTPDGPGNVKSVDLLRETVKVSLDSSPEMLHCYHNCEICLLRNGKGSREGIKIPERPERLIQESSLEESGDMGFSSSAYEDRNKDREQLRERNPNGEIAQRDTSSERSRRSSRRSRSSSSHTSKQDVKRSKFDGKQGERSTRGAKPASGKQNSSSKKEDSKRRRSSRRNGYRRNKSNGDS